MLIVFLVLPPIIQYFIHLLPPGAWHIVPCSMFRDVFVIRDYVKVDDRLHEELKRTKNTVVLYCHGETENSVKIIFLNII